MTNEDCWQGREIQFIIYPRQQGLPGYITWKYLLLNKLTHTIENISRARVAVGFVSEDYAGAAVGIQIW